MTQTPPQLMSRFLLSPIWNKPLSYYIRTTHSSLLKEFYNHSQGNIVATTSGAEIFMGSIRRVLYDETLDLGLSKFKVRETLKQHPDIAEYIIDRSMEEANCFLMNHMRRIKWFCMVRKKKVQVKGLVIKFYPLPIYLRRI